MKQPCVFASSYVERGSVGDEILAYGVGLHPVEAVIAESLRNAGLGPLDLDVTEPSGKGLSPPSPGNVFLLVSALLLQSESVRSDFGNVRASGCDAFQ